MFESTIVMDTVGQLSGLSRISKCLDQGEIVAFGWRDFY